MAKLKTRVSGVKRLVIVAVLVIGIGWAAAPLRERLRQRAELYQLQTETKRVRQDNRALRARIAGLKGDDAFLELVARRRLGLIKPGEEAFAVITSKESSGHGSADSSASTEKNND